MTIKIFKPIAAATFVSLALAGCASESSPLATGSVTTPQVAAKTASVDPACVALRAKIVDLRKEGTMSRLAKVATGKSSSVRVKRSALGRAAQLDSANAQFMNKCSAFGSSTALAIAPSNVKTKAVLTPKAVQKGVFGKPGSKPAKTAAKVAAAASTSNAFGAAKK